MPRWRQSRTANAAHPVGGRTLLNTEALRNRPARSTGDVLRRFTPSHPLVRGGLIVGSGIVLGNLVGFIRVAVTAFLLGTRSRADVLAVALGPLDAFNGALINTMIFAFVPMLTLQPERERIAFFLAARRLFMWIFGGMTAAAALFAPWLIDILGLACRQKARAKPPTSSASSRSPP